MEIHVHIHYDCPQKHGRLTTLAELAAILTLLVSVLTLAWTVLHSEPAVIKVELAPVVVHHPTRRQPPCQRGSGQSGSWQRPTMVGASLVPPRGD